MKHQPEHTGAPDERKEVVGKKPGRAAKDPQGESCATGAELMQSQGEPDECNGQEPEHGVHSPFDRVVQAEWRHGIQERRRERGRSTADSFGEQPDQGKGCQSPEHRKETQGQVGGTGHPGPQVQQQVVEWRARVGELDGPDDAAGAGRRALMLQVPSVRGWRLSLALLDEVAAGGVSVSRRMLQTVTCGHGEGEQLVGPEAPLAGEDQTQHDGHAEQEKSRKHAPRPRTQAIGSESTGRFIDRENRERARGQPDAGASALAMGTPRVVVLGGGLSGMAAAYTLARAGVGDVTLLEAGATLGGLAGSFEREDHFYPLGYHHILHRDRALLYFLELIGALPDVVWRRIQMLFHLGGQAYDLASPSGFLRFPMSLADKARFIRLMVKTFSQPDWTGWQDRSAAELVDHYGSAGVREALFERLTRLKFDLPCRDVSGAWLGARLHFREGSAPLGYIPHANWTKVLCDGVTQLLQEAGIQIRLRAPVARLHTSQARVVEAELESGERISGDVFISTVPTRIYLGLVPEDTTPQLSRIRYTALISAICATRQAVTPQAYWNNLASLDRTAGAIFLLSALNPTIGREGDTCVNFVTHLPGCDHPLFRLPKDQLMARYADDFREVFGFELQPFWTHISRVPMYSPVFDRGFRNPPMMSTSWGNVYFAGNYRTFPSIVSTGTALGSGVATASALLGELGRASALSESIANFRLRSMPRANPLKDARALL